jgi:hypothetical protein
VNKTAKSLSVAGWQPWQPWQPWFGKVAKSTLSKLLLLLKAANMAKKLATRARR